MRRQFVATFSPSWRYVAGTRCHCFLRRIAAAWKLSLVVGVAGALASFGWFMAMTIQQAAVVKSLAQIEMLFTFAATVFFFKERINRLEVAGCALIVGGILVLLSVG